MTAGSLRRCAIYTRKSSEEGLEQGFNSLDAQREACEAYVQSQKSEGWKLVRTRYDDGGYSGGTLERPALELLLADIEAGKIDIIVVYKVDRLTRSLTDFAKIVEVFDANDTSFVSVTQQFNTTTSMGRLTLNMLLSFAQFEREVTGERIRDKIAASKRKGLWMGGYVPLGYEANGRTLAIVPEEAKTVRALFRLYLELGSVQKVWEEANRLRLKSKIRWGAGGKMSGGKPFGRGHIYRLLGNPIYAGRIAHKGECHEGQHPAIIDPATWETVQARLAVQAPARSPGASRRSSLLRGKLFEESGVGLTPSHTVKSGRRYRYYVSRDPSAPMRGGKVNRRSSWRLPANEIERLVRESAAACLADEANLTRSAREGGLRKGRVADLLARVRSWSGEPLEFVQRVDLSRKAIILHVDLSRLVGEVVGAIRYVVPTRIRRRGVEMRLIVQSDQAGASDSRVDPALVKAIVRGRQWFEDLVSGRARSLAEIARAEGVSDRYVSHLVPLAFLAPDVVDAILSGTQPVDLTAEVLTRRTDLPVAWGEQKELLGLD